MSHETISINPELLTWARRRAGLELPALTNRFPKLAAWEAGQAQPTLRQLETFAHVVHIPIGYLFLPQPVQETVPIPDFRTLADQSIAHPSPNLLDTLYLCQQRQDWYRDYASWHGLPTLDFIDTVTTATNPLEVATMIGQTLQLSLAERQQLPNVQAALRQFITKAEERGILVMASSVVGSNSHRKLNVEEFRGFALVDGVAPLIFLNAADSKAGQMFTLAHELAHLWLGASGISNSDVGHLPKPGLERWCNTVAAELLIPLNVLHEAYAPDRPLPDQLQPLAKRFKVSTLVVLRRLFEAGFIDQDTLWQHYHQEIARIETVGRGGSGGGDFYRTLTTRTGKRFAQAVLSSTLAGQTLFRDAFRMLGIKKSATLYKAAQKLEVLS